MANPTTHALFHWKTVSYALVLMFFVITPMLIFIFHPNSMAIYTQAFGCFSVFLLLTILIPDQEKQNTRTSKKAFFFIVAWILFAELFIFILSDEFALFAFRSPGQAINTTPLLPNWPIWLGIWSYFSTTIVMQHYAYYQTQKPSIASGLLFHFKNTYLDIALRRALGLVSVGVNLGAIYLLSVNLLFILLEYCHRPMLQQFHFFSLLFLGLFSLLTLLIQTKKIKFYLQRIALNNMLYFSIAIAFCAGAIGISALPSQYFSLFSIFNENTFSPVEFSTADINAGIFLFPSLFVLITPFFTSLIVKYSKNISRKKLLFISFCWPNLFYFTWSHNPSSVLPIVFQSKQLFVVMTIIFLIIFLRGKTSSAFITGSLPMPKQRAIAPVNSYVLLPTHSMILFNFYLLAIIVGPIILYSLTMTASLLSALIGTLSIVSYFGSAYRSRRVFFAVPPSQK